TLMRRLFIAFGVLLVLPSVDAVWAQGIPGVPKAGIRTVRHKSKRPPGVCGNNVREGLEGCDGSDAMDCPGSCLSDCTCPSIGCGQIPIAQADCPNIPTCPAGLVCSVVNGTDCKCLAGAVPCDRESYPTCGGVCPQGQVCQSLQISGVPYGSCACVN